jgi:hypothetical protein
VEVVLVNVKATESSEFDPKMETKHHLNGFSDTEVFCHKPFCVTTCLSKDCTGSYTDTISESVLILCKDPKHKISEEGCSGSQPQTTNPADNHGSIVSAPGPVKRKHGT